MLSFRDFIYTSCPLSDFKYIIQDIIWVVIRAKNSYNDCKVYRKKYVNSETYFDEPDKVIRDVWDMFK